MSRILYVEDDLSLTDGLMYTLLKNGFEVDNARTVTEALGFQAQNRYDLLLLDVTLPDGTGFDICSQVRKKSPVPIIFLTASDEEVNVVKGLDLGGDDYITKPFRLNELISRIKALLRRSGAAAENHISSNGISIDMVQQLVLKNGIPVELTLMEYRLLCLLMQNPGRILPRQLILDRLWDGCGNYVDDNTLSVYIRRLRGKLEEDPNSPEMLLTERGFGYKWKLAD